MVVSCIMSCIQLFCVNALAGWAIRKTDGYRYSLAMKRVRRILNMALNKYTVFNTFYCNVLQSPHLGLHLCFKYFADASKNLFIQKSDFEPKINILIIFLGTIDCVE